RRSAKGRGRCRDSSGLPMPKASTTGPRLLPSPQMPAVLALNLVVGNVVGELLRAAALLFLPDDVVARRMRDAIDAQPCRVPAVPDDEEILGALAGVPIEIREPQGFLVHERAAETAPIHRHDGP